MTQEVSQKTKDEFIQECCILRILPNEVCLTIQLGNIVQFYIHRVGLHPVLESWDELRVLLINALTIAKSANSEKKPFHIRFAGGNVPVWLVMRIYSLCVYEADQIFYIGDCVIKV